MTGSITAGTARPVRVKQRRAFAGTCAWRTIVIQDQVALCILGLDS